MIFTRKKSLFAPLKWAILYLALSLILNYIFKHFFPEPYQYVRLIICFIFFLAIVSLIRFLFGFLYFILLGEKFSKDGKLQGQTIHEMPIGIFSIVPWKDRSSNDPMLEPELTLLRLSDSRKIKRDFLSFEVPTGDYETTLYYNNDGSVGILYFSNDRRRKNYEPFLSMAASQERKQSWTGGELVVDSGEIFFHSDHFLEFDLQLEQDLAELPHHFTMEIIKEQKGLENCESQQMRLYPFFGDGAYSFKIFCEKETGTCFFALELTDGSFVKSRLF